MSECRRHILASHVCPMHILGGDRLELVMDYTSSKTRPLTISSRGIVWGHGDINEAYSVFYDILLGRKDPLTATKPDLTPEKTVVASTHQAKAILANKYSYPVSGQYTGICAGLSECWRN